MLELFCIEASPYLVIWSAPHTRAVVQASSGFEALFCCMLLLLLVVFATHRQLLASCLAQTFVQDMLFDFDGVHGHKANAGGFLDLLLGWEC